MAKLGDTRDLIRELAELLDSSSLTEIEVEDEDVRIRVARQIPAPTPMTPAAPQTPSAAEQHGSVPAATDETPAASPQDPDSHPGMVPAPMVGTAYLAPEPGAATFVTEGATVTEGQTILIIEAMKVMNHIEAPRAGKITKILVGSGQPVEYGEPLMIIE